MADTTENSPDDMQTLDVPGGKLPYEVQGEGHPLLLIHAGIADHTMWDAQMEPFSQHYRVIRYDTRGFGKFFTEAVEFSNRADIVALLKHLDVDKAYVIGVSRGGQIATDFALEHPEMVDALVLVGSGLGGFEEPAPTEAEMQLFDQEEALMEAKDWERMADLDVQVWVDGPGQPAGRADATVRQKVRAMCLNTYSSHTTEGQPIVLSPPAAGRLHDIKMPTLVIIGDLDVSGIQAAAEALSQGIPEARKVVLHNVAHVPPMEVPDEFNSLVLDFLGKIDKGA